MENSNKEFSIYFINPIKKNFMNTEYMSIFLIVIGVIAMFMLYVSFKNWTQHKESGSGVIGWLVTLIVSGMALELIHKLNDCINK